MYSIWKFPKEAKNLIFEEIEKTSFQIIGN